MRLTILHVKIFHTVVFAVLSACVLYVLYSGALGPVTFWTWVSIGAVVIEGLILAASGWKCPLTSVAERLGAERGSVADIFLPGWFADRLFPICGTLFLLGCVLVTVRLLSR
jgi:hypothetical protein